MVELRGTTSASENNGLACKRGASGPKEFQGLTDPSVNNARAEKIADAAPPRHFDPIEEASRDDARWFSQNPRRSHRIRPPVLGEFGIPEPDTARPLKRWVMVRQVKPGVRMRLSFVMSGSPVFTETAAKAICDRLLGIGGAAIFGGRGNA